MDKQLDRIMIAINDFTIGMTAIEAAKYMQDMQDDINQGEYLSIREFIEETHNLNTSPKHVKEKLLS